MSDGAVFALAESACVEPLVGRWPAWAHVMAPAAFSLHLVNYQVKTLRSYLDNPGLHEKSCRDPRLLGGAFVDIPSERTPEVAALLRDMEDSLKENVDFAHALTEFHNWLVREAKGESLESYYRRLPPALRGYVELVYDYYNRPIVRCLEGMLYNSPYYKRELQSFRLFRQEHDLSRPYYMSTPRLPDENAIDWDVRFDDPRVDELFRLDCRPRSFGEIRELLDLSPEDEGRLAGLLQEVHPERRERWRGSGVRIRYFGHACVLVESADVSILIDPLIAVRPESCDIERFSYDDLPDQIDYALITHGHHDHFVIETLLRLRHKIKTLVVPKNCDAFFADMSLRLLAGRLGFRGVREVECLDELAIADGQIVAIPFLGEHNDLPSAKSAYFIRIGGQTLLFAADSNCLDPAIYAHVCRITGPIDTLFVGMECVGAPLAWVYGPILPIKPDHRHSKDRRSNGCNSATAFELARAIQCRRAFVYAVGREPWVRFLLALEPSDDDVYMTEIGSFARRLEEEAHVEARRLFGKAELFM
ncbi:MBL fold metallo-hydrolase [Methylosinus sp. RM1]|uniref:MBL fold metallo-hydrolase n=1 Tax=Methylosinus sp. RM1 TaxID=2583817 RepID=UPI00140B4CBB|nr:MBL fold metallo-hydrolase [Methylosinus sp. RM1]